MAWHPSPDETFVYLHVGSGKRFVLMVPGGGAPKSVTLHTELGDALYYLDEAMTDKTRMFVSVDNRKRGLAD